MLVYKYDWFIEGQNFMVTLDVKCLKVLLI